MTPDELSLPDGDAVIAAVLAGLATPEERARFEERFAKDADFARSYARQAETAAFLHLLLDSKSRFAAPRFRRFAAFRWQAACAAACLVLALGAGVFARGRRSCPPLAAERGRMQAEAAEFLRQVPVPKTVEPPAVQPASVEAVTPSPERIEPRKETQMEKKPILTAVAATATTVAAAMAAASNYLPPGRTPSAPAATNVTAAVSIDGRAVDISLSSGAGVDSLVPAVAVTPGVNLKTTKWQGFVIMLK